jgi:hypothetical protein
LKTDRLKAVETSLRIKARGKYRGGLHVTVLAIREAGMTKSQEQGANEFTELAKREAARTGRDVCDILKILLRKAKAAKDKDLEQKIKRAEKYLGCRNRRKRGNTP